MKTQGTLFLLFSLIFFNCKSQKVIKSKDLRTFNIEKFQKHIDAKTNNKTAQEIEDKFISKFYEYKEKDTIINLSKVHQGFYREERFKENSVRKKIYTYYENTYSLANEGEYFLGMPIGVHKRYSKDGILIEEKNYDLNNDGILSIPQMIKIMKSKFKIDIEREDEIIFMETVKENARLVWRIVCKGHSERQIMHNYSYFFDAKTGQFLNREKFTLEG